MGSAMNAARLLRAPLAVGYFLGITGMASRNDGCARILMLHGTPRSEARRLERMLRWLRRHFEVVPLAQIARDAARGDVRFRRQVALTFDDGLRNNVEVAYPILKRLGLPATFFVCPSLIDAGRWLWNHEARQRLLRMSRSAHDIDAIVRQMKALPLDKRVEMERSIRARTREFQPTPEERHRFDLAGWQELRSLDPSIVTIGSHTLTHAILTSLQPGELEAELGDSRRVLESRLGRGVEELAYPNGDFNEAVLACARRHYATAVSVEDGFVRQADDPLRLPRVNAPFSVFRLALAVHREKRATSLSPRSARPAARWPAPGTP